MIYIVKLFAATDGAIKALSEELLLKHAAVVDAVK